MSLLAKLECSDLFHFFMKLRGSSKEYLGFLLDNVILKVIQKREDLQEVSKEKQIEYVINLALKDIRDFNNDTILENHLVSDIITYLIYHKLGGKHEYYKLLFSCQNYLNRSSYDNAQILKAFLKEKNK